MQRADLYLDARAGASEKAGDIRLALASGALTPDRIIAEIGATPVGGLPLSSGSDVRVFKSMGIAVQDVVLAHHLVGLAESAKSRTHRQSGSGARSRGGEGSGMTGKTLLIRQGMILTLDAGEAYPPAG